MIDPPRLADENGPGASLLRAAQGEPPPAAVLERTLVAVSAGAATTLVSSAATAKSSVEMGSLIAKYALIGFASGALTVGGATAIHYEVMRNTTHSERPAPSPPATHATARAAATVPVEPRTLPEPERFPAPAPDTRAHPPSRPYAESPTTPASPTPAPTTELAPAAGLSPATPTATESFASDSAMAVEVRLLDDARRALGAGRNQDALGLLGRYAREAPSRRLAPEAAYLEMEANRALGDRAAAVRSAAALLDRYPDGPHAARARRILRGE